MHPRKSTIVPVVDTFRTPKNNAIEWPNGFTGVSYHGEMQVIDSDVTPSHRTNLEDVDSGIVWMRNADAVTQIVNQATIANREWSFGWLLLSDLIPSTELIQELALLGASLISDHGKLRRARLPGNGEQLRAITKIRGIDALGATAWESKLTRELSSSTEPTRSGHRRVFITLMPDDSDGRWGRELEGAGVDIARYDPDINVYVGVVEDHRLESISALDFVLRIEPVRDIQKMHDTSVPSMGVDTIRWLARLKGTFEGVGGTSVPIGVVDTGLNLSHVDISTHRESICGANFQWLGRSPDEDLWIDYDGHGTHVTATIAGTGSADPRFVGIAPSIKHIRFAKVLSIIGADEEDVIQGMDFLSRATGCEDSPQVLPLIVNLSLGGSSKFFEGRETSSRKTDAIVWNQRQLYVVAQSNDGSDGLSQFATAKNSLAVGAVLDSGEIAYFSSHGPTSDGRLAPNVVGTGVDVCSAKGDGSVSGYVCSSGTSMAAPSVAGVAALLIDSEPAYRKRPALSRATLMASAIRPDPWFDNSSQFPLNNTNGPGLIQNRYGMGKVSAITAISSQTTSRGWEVGSATAELSKEGEVAYQEIEVPNGTQRLDIVMTWDESPADVVVAPVLNDLDLWVDYLADCGIGACGEQSSSSRIDNVEWIVIRAPKPGKHRIKVVAHRIYSVSPRIGLAWVAIRGAVSPQLKIDVDSTTIRSSSSEQVSELKLSVSSSDFVAAGSRLHLNCLSENDYCEGVELTGLLMDRLDKVQVDGSITKRRVITPSFPIALDSKIPLGDIPIDQPRELQLTVRHAREKPILIYVGVSSWNGIGESTVIELGSQNISSDPPVLAGSPNDMFDTPTELKGSYGSELVETIGMTTEPAEPLYRGPCLNNDCFSSTYRGCPLIRNIEYYERPTNTVWYEWTASTNDVVRLWLTNTEGNEVSASTLTAYDGEEITSVSQIASNHWEEPRVLGRCFYEARRRFTDQLSFIANRGSKYRFRVETSVPRKDLVLHWSQGRPENDDFANPIRLNGERGVISDRNAGATTELDEQFGSLAATVWYKWIAPKDGVWEFEIDVEEMRTAVFLGNDLKNARLMSEFPDTEARLKVERGQEYRILVAAEHGGTYPQTFELNWRESWSSRFFSNDLFSDAEELNVGDRMLGSLSSATVEPGEPMSTGIRTKWWRFQAKETGEYTLKNGDEDIDLVVNVFSGSDVSNVELVATNSAYRTNGELVFEGQEGTEYFISLGWPIGDNRAYLSEYGSTSFWKFGTTPLNDERNGAISISGSTGEIVADAEYATTGTDELKDRLGRWSLWWRFESAESNWYRFFTTGGIFAPDIAFAVYEGNELDIPLIRSGWLDDEDGITFYAEAGKEYVIRTGIQGYGLDPEYTLKWELTRVPTWLRYAGSAFERVNKLGDRIQLDQIGNLTIDQKGEVVFATVPTGLAVFSTRMAGAELVPVTTLDVAVESPTLIWDDSHDRLLVNQCNRWNSISYSRTSDGFSFESRHVDISGESSECPSKLIIVDNSLYRVIPLMSVETYEINSEGAIRFVGSLSIDGVTDVVAHSDGSRLYTGGRRLMELTRDSETGLLSVSASTYVNAQGPIAISRDGSQLFVVNQRSYDRMGVYSITEGISREIDSLFLSGYLFSRLDGEKNRYWETSLTRSSQPAIDLLGTDGAISIKWEDGELVLAEELGDGSDRFSNFVPLFGEVTDALETPDGRYVYVGTASHGIIVLERIPTETVSETNGEGTKLVLIDH